MKKWLLFAVVALLLFIPAVVSAQPAAPLTKVQIVGIGSDGGGWEPIAFNQTTANNPLSGTIGYIAVYVEGTHLGYYPAIRSNGTVVSTTQYLPNEYVTDGTGRVIGTIYYRQFDLADVATGRISATAVNYYPPNQSITDNLYVTVN